jgi:uncharacterized peroxidase-related enzyme
MAHIDLAEGLPGIMGPLAFRPETARPLNDLAEVLLRGENSLSRGERETIAAYVSNLNECRFCHASHATFAGLQTDGGRPAVDAAVADPASASISPTLRALLGVAAKVQQGGRNVTDTEISAARAAGATDTEIHDTVLIAAAFCMFNRYVDGLGTWAPDGDDAYLAVGQRIVEHGYASTTPVVP